MSKFSRQHYELVAKILRTRLDAQQEAWEVSPLEGKLHSKEILKQFSDLQKEGALLTRQIADDFAVMFYWDNSGRFDARRFYDKLGENFPAAVGQVKQQREMLNRGRSS